MDPRDIPASSGIYRITCTVTGKFYIGSAHNLHRRYRDHFSYLRRNSHHNPKLQHAFNKYGEQSFIFDVLELVLPIFLTAREQYWFNKLKPFGNRGFNVNFEADSRMGMRHSPESCEKNRQSHLGKTPSPETCEKLRITSKGNTHALGNKLSLETRKRMGQSRIGNTINLGRTHAPEVYASRMQTIIATSPDGTEYLVCGVQRFCKEHDLDCSHLLRVAKGVKSQHKGWTARYP